MLKKTKETDRKKLKAKKKTKDQGRPTEGPKDSTESLQRLNVSEERQE